MFILKWFWGSEFGGLAFLLTQRLLVDFIKRWLHEFSPDDRRL